jgi:hypothetical protein
MRSRALHLALVLLSVFVLSQGSAQASATNPPWGFQDFIWDTHTWHPGSQLTTDSLVQASAADGATIARLVVGWSWVEPQNDVYHWASVDAQYRAMAANGIRPVVMVYAAPTWARAAGVSCSDCAIPPDSTHYADWRSFLEALIQHIRSLDADYPGYQGPYGIEIWNEPNEQRFFYPSPDAGAYVQLLSRARKAASATGFTKPIISGGLEAVTSTVQGQRIATDAYLTQMYRHKFQSYVDGIGIHPGPKGSTQLVADMNTAPHTGIDPLNTIRTQHKDPHPFWVTKAGVSSVPCAVTDCSGPQDPTAGVSGDTAQGNTLVDLYRSVATRPVRAFLVFHFEEYAPPGDDWAGYGIVDTSSGSIVPKQSFCILGQQIGNGNPGYGC